MGECGVEGREEAGVGDVKWLQGAERRWTYSDDGLRLGYESLGAEGPVILLANGLGGRLIAWKNLIEAVAGRYRILTWDYRGMFSSQSPDSPRDFSIDRHVADARRILDAEGIDRAALIGWSMGVQVCLEFALEYPERVSRMVLINGTYGRAITTTLQPLWDSPWIGKAVRRSIDLTIASERLRGFLKLMGNWRTVHRVIGCVLRSGMGKAELEAIYCQYMRDVFGDSFENYVRLFREIDVHEAGDRLERIGTSTLVVSGGLDFVTPARYMAEMARKIPNAVHLHFPLASHYVVLERPRRAMPEIVDFLDSALVSG